MRDARGRAVPVILYSTSFHRWEVWKGGRPVAQGSLESCQQAYPTAPEPSEMQHRLARNDDRAPMGMRVAIDVNMPGPLRSGKITDEPMDHEAAVASYEITHEEPHDG